MPQQVMCTSDIKLTGLTINLSCDMNLTRVYLEDNEPLEATQVVHMSLTCNTYYHVFKYHTFKCQL